MIQTSHIKNFAFLTNENYIFVQNETFILQIKHIFCTYQSFSRINKPIMVAITKLSCMIFLIWKDLSGTEKICLRQKYSEISWFEMLGMTGIRLVIQIKWKVQRIRSSVSFWQTSPRVRDKLGWIIPLRNIIWKYSVFLSFFVGFIFDVCLIN